MSGFRLTSPVTLASFRPRPPEIRLAGRPLAHAVGSLIALGLAYWILARSCGYAHLAIARYALYLGLAVWLPGHSLLSWIQRGRVRTDQSLAVGLPLGFAYEILVYLGCAAAGWREVYPLVSLAGTTGLLAWVGRRRGWRELVPARLPVGPEIRLALAVTALILMGITAARMYAAAPLVDGLLQHRTHHDWVYLLSRAGQIKNHWPLEDPSLAGTPLSYHYFLMAHVAAASQTTGLEIPLILLRLVFLPLGLALLGQVFSLGHIVGRSAWSGVLAIILLLVAGEVSWGEAPAGGRFQDFFIAWLYISPTFYFGMIFMGALMLWLHRVLCGAADLRAWGGLYLLAVAGTGAKGTTVGPLAAALALWCAWQWAGRRQWPTRAVTAGLILVAGFLTAYLAFLLGYHGEGMGWQPFAFTQMAPFWVDNMEGWQRLLAGRFGLAPGLAGGLAGLAAAIVVLVGLNGVLLAGFLHAFRSRREDGFALYLGLIAVACAVFGNVLFLDSDGEAYLYLPMKLPLAVLTAAAITAGWRRAAGRARLTPGQARVGIRLAVGGVSTVIVAALTMAGLVSWGTGMLAAGAMLWLLAPARADIAGPPAQRSALGPLVRELIPFAPLLVVMALQVCFSAAENRGGLALWQAQGASASDPTLVELSRGLQWIRRNTPADAVIVAATFAHEPAADAARVVDWTTPDKYYYYSALAERSLFIEGPCYVRDQQLAAERMQAVAALMRGKPFALPPELQGHSAYLLLDREALPRAPVVLRAAVPVYTNSRIQLYRLIGG